MKILTLLRHAKSGWDDPSLPDFERPLNARGRAAARAIGAEMRRLGLAWDCVLASPAARVTQTIDGLAESCGPLAPVYDERVYLATAETLLALVRAADDGCESLLIVGHNPGLERLALLLGRPGPLRDEIAAKYPTGALAEIAFPVDHWRDAGPSGGTLARFTRPRDLQG
ncbi:MAG TPA: histidine phosphatase family protein [Allosphingosinicella sp.]|nr:histidine phosphatase family protein [Allosphingosinicella sp.]